MFQFLLKSPNSFEIPESHCISCILTSSSSSSSAADVSMVTVPPTTVGLRPVGLRAAKTGMESLWQWRLERGVKTGQLGPGLIPFRTSELGLICCSPSFKGESWTPSTILASLFIFHTLLRNTKCEL